MGAREGQPSKSPLLRSDQVGVRVAQCGATLILLLLAAKATMMRTRVAASSSFPVFTVLFLIFLVLKLTHQIHWSWWWVTAPLWGPLAAFGVVLVVLGALAVIGLIAS